MGTRATSARQREVPFVALGLGILSLFVVTGCQQKTELYCCSTLDSCRASGSDEVVQCTDPARSFCDDSGIYPASEGIRNTCIAEPEPPAECVAADECSDPDRPLCEEGRCVACASAEDCRVDAPVCGEAGECTGCTGPADCAAYPEAGVCASDGACVGCAAASDCGAAAPVCDEENNTCRTCTVDEECGAGACDLILGTCAAESAVLYIEPGARGIECTVNLPCGSLAQAAAAATETRRLVRIAAGTYTGTTELSGVSLRVFADPGTVMRPTPGGSATIEVTGTGEVLLYGIEISGATADTGGRALRCIDVKGSPTLTLVKSSVKDAPGLGIEASNCTLEITQNEVSGNAGGGVSASGGRFTLVNNFLVANGSPTATVGGAAVSGQADSRFEHNTVANNQVQDGVEGGLSCTASITATNNIIYGNDAGDEGQITGNCSHRFSLIGPEPEKGKGNLADPPTFVDASSGDFHLMPTSVGVDQGESSEVSEDIEGDARPQGRGADMGADEVSAR